MKREDLKALGLADEAIDSVMGLHGKDIEAHKTATGNLQAQLDAANAQLTEANTTIEGFKKLKPDELQAAADDWKAKYEQAQKDSVEQLAKVKFDHALESALVGAKVKNPKAVQALLSADKLKLKDDGSLEGFDEQIKVIREKDDYLFADTKEPPKIVSNANNQTVTGDAVVNAARQAAGLVTQQK